MFSARDATEADYPLYVRLFSELDAASTPAPRERWTSEHLPRTLVLERSGDVLGYGMFNLYATTGYVVHLVVDPRARREGVGRALLGVMVDRFRDAGLSSWALDVKVGNEPAIALYESMGLRPVHVSTSLCLDWAGVARLPREDRAPAARLVDPAEDQSIEAAFDLPRGQLGVLRTRRGRILMRLVDPVDPGRIDVGFGVFDPAWPGAYPFRVARPTLAAALFEAFRDHLPAGADLLHVVADGDEDLLRALLEVGAAERFSTLHMSGPIPPADAAP